MRISDWSSDVCSSDLERKIPHGLLRGRQRPGRLAFVGGQELARHRALDAAALLGLIPGVRQHAHRARQAEQADRKSVVEGQSESVRVDLGGRRIIKKKIKQKTHRISE